MCGCVGVCVCGCMGVCTLRTLSTIIRQTDPWHRFPRLRHRQSRATKTGSQPSDNKTIKYTHARTHTQTHTHARTHTLSLSNTHTHTLSLTHTHTHPLSHTHTLCLTPTCVLQCQCLTKQAVLCAVRCHRYGVFWKVCSVFLSV